MGQSQLVNVLNEGEPTETIAESYMILDGR
jgi:hypothetical protein